MKQILIVDDEVHILELLKFNLESAGFAVIEATSGEQAVEILRERRGEIDGVLLDYMLPGMDGLDVLRNIRQSDAHLPVIMLTAKNEELDAVIGLEVGADDYVGKPFRVRELISRVKKVVSRVDSFHRMLEQSKEPIMPRATDETYHSQTSRTGDPNEAGHHSKTAPQASSKTLRDGNLTLDPLTHRVWRNGTEIVLTLKEFELLEKLMGNPEQVFTREQLLEEIWGYDFMGETRTVDVHIRQIRKKIEDDDANPERVLTIRGLGYKYRRKGAPR